ncbi:methylated-DNA--[protein]-cysteine S-methyltransferase [Egbenema bharatensis]|uniref:methylated-DNA--[protein]-cysteine S-methyltransferase n=1 Tax=Egbenema bharatensis TaxID=3463334 RepID=UPI003A8432B8
MKPLIEATTYNSETYGQIARAIAFMRQTYLDQPDLATVAQQVHLSESHFQRLFTQWAGISPKRFWQYLTVEYAKSKIAETKSLLDLTVDIGLSSPGRLHDLFVKLEAMSPGEFKAGGAGLQIQYGLHPSPFGECLIATTARGICNLQFLDSFDPNTVESLLRSEWPNAEIVRNQSAIQAIGDRIFLPTVPPSQPLNLFVKGTNFQIQVWRALLNLPPGGITTYQGLAHAIGRPTAARAIGNAIGRNPVGYLIPCHRVIRESGELGGYRWGLDRKTVLLGWEASRCEQ